MALGFDGFDLYNGRNSGNHQVIANWPTANGTGGNNTQAYLSSGGRFGGGCMQFTNAASGICNILKLAGFSSSTGTIGGGFLISAGAASAVSGRGVIEAYEGNGVTEHLALYVFSDNTVRLFRGTTQLAASSAITGILNAWHWIEMSFNIADSGGSVTGYVDGVNVVTFSGDTRNGGTAGKFEAVVVGSGGAIGVHKLDDIYWSDSSTPLGDARVDVIPPTSDTVQKDFHASSGTDNYAMVAEAPNDGDSSYVFSGSSTAKDLYGLGDLATSSSAIYGVQLNVVAKRADAGSATLTLHAKSSTTDASDAGHTLTSSYLNYQDLLLTDPATSAAWTDSGVNSLLAGFDLVAS